MKLIHVTEALQVLAPNLLSAIGTACESCDNCQIADPCQLMAESI